MVWPKYTTSVWGLLNCLSTVSSSFFLCHFEFIQIKSMYTKMKVHTLSFITFYVSGHKNTILPSAGRINYITQHISPSNYIFNKNSATLQEQYTKTKCKHQPGAANQMHSIIRSSVSVSTSIISRFFLTYSLYSQQIF